MTTHNKSWCLGVKGRLFLAFLIILLLSQTVCERTVFGAGTAKDGEDPKKNWWVEVGSDIGYQRTNAWYKTQKDFGISILSSRGGLRYYFKDKKYLFLDPYVKAELLYDLGSKEQNRFFWDNSIKYGPGVRLRLEYKNEKTFKPEAEYKLRLNYANLDYFGEYLGIGFINRGGTDVPNSVPRKDARTGFNSWLSIDNKISFNNRVMESGGVWFEMWTDLSYHSTNFFTKGMDDFVILTLSPKVGLRASLPGAMKGVALEPYFRCDYVHDFLSRDWNKEAWSNNTKYGPGFRLSLGGLTKRTDTNIYLYVEYVNIHYASRVGWKSDGLSNYDIRAGINLWIPFGASKGSQGPAH